MKLTSTAFLHEGKIPSKHTCDGLNVNPPLSVADIPSNAKSLVLIMDDPDIPDFVKQKYGIQVWDHWVLINIGTNVSEIAENSVPSGAVQGKNTGGKNAYGGPCPPDKEHRYFFKLYALDTKLDLNEGTTKAEVEKAMQDHIIAETVLVGKYERIQ